MAETSPKRVILLLNLLFQFFAFFDHHHMLCDKVCCLASHSDCYLQKDKEKITRRQQSYFM